MLPRSTTSITATSRRALPSGSRAGKPRDLIAFALLLLLCTRAPLARAETHEISYPFLGVRHIHRTMTLPRLVDLHVVEIDMTAPGIGALVTPPNGAASGETSAQTTRAFVTQRGAQIGINGSFFSSASGGGLNISGLAVSSGTVYSTFEPGRVDALNITANNIASVIYGTTGAGTTHAPLTTLYNAITGSEKIVTSGLNTASSSDFATALHPRSAAGVTADGKLLLMTVDGRQEDHSLGMSLSEVANVLIEFGARQAINLDGGGSTTLVFADPAPRLVNVPSGGERAVGNNLGIFATPLSGPISSQLIYADFEGGSANFGYPLTYSGNTQGIVAAASRTDRTTAFRHTGRYSQRLIIDADSTIASTPDNPNGWFVRHVSGHAGGGTPATPVANTPRETRGQIGFWAMTFAPGIEATIAIDDPANVTADRGVLRPLISDGQWHRYAWDLEDDDDWEGWLNGDGTVRTSTITIDSIQFLGNRADAVIYLDDVFHEIMPTRALSPTDHNSDGLVNRDDLRFWQHAFGVDAGGDADNDADADGADFLAWQRRLGAGTSTASAGGQPVPEPAPSLLALALIAAALRSRRADH